MFEQIFQQLTNIKPDLNRTLGIPPTCYSSDDFLKIEKSHLFHRGWLPLGRADRWIEIGQYSAIEIVGMPLIVIRNGNNQLKTFSNTCRHRGSTLLDGNGTCKKIKCPFHWWTYDLDGQLKVYPRMENITDFDPTENGLMEFQTEIRLGFAFVNLGGDDRSIDNYLGDFDQLHSEWDLSNFKTTRCREFEVNCNWKTFIEVFNEYYHLPSVHPDSINWLYPEPEPVDEVTGNYTTQFGETAGNAALMADSQTKALPTVDTLTGRFRLGTRYTWIYPNITYALSQDSMWIYQAFPINADRSHIIQTIAFPAAATALDDFDERVSHYYKRIDAAVAEDLPFLEKQQTGLASPFAQAGRFGALEPSVGKFAYWYGQQFN
ncbi:MAG: phenylpropionate dioxygenase-like ring-hydroxylating dioxygenase large terminal subunit [Gammaproteobacteria bacterium]|jgi:phenylpropionate dioxygenase-like ring-hydroxylating dioxygenase large terminal subunit